MCVVKETSVKNLKVVVVLLVVGLAVYMLLGPEPKPAIVTQTVATPEAREFLADPGAGLAPAEKKKGKEGKATVVVTVDLNQVLVVAKRNRDASRR